MCYKRVLLFLAVSTTAVICKDNISSPAFWKGTILDSHIEKVKTACAERDSIACLQYNAFKFLDGIFKRDYFQLRGNVEVKRNTYAANEVSSRSNDNLEDTVEDFIKTHDVTFTLPAVGQVTVDSTSLDNEEIGIKLNFGSGQGLEARKKKNKLRKILSPIFIFLLLKAITVIPLIIGMLGLKAWNSLQLAFMAFVISTGLAVFQLCQKLAADHAQSHAHISSAGPWETVGGSPWGRSLADEDAQNMAYSAYAQ